MICVRRNAISFSEKADVLSIVAESELANELDEGILILVLVLRVACDGVVPVVLNVDTELVNIRSLWTGCVDWACVFPGTLRRTILSMKIRSVSTLSMAAISSSAWVITHFCLGSHQASFARSITVSVKNLLNFCSSMIPCHNPLR